jgi:hypothetical protein
VIFVFLSLAYFTYMVVSSSISFPENDIISFCFWPDNTLECECACVHVCVCMCVCV